MRDPAVFGIDAYNFRSIDGLLLMSDDNQGNVGTTHEAGDMKERRKKRDRRLSAPKHGLPPYYTRAVRDRRRNERGLERKHPEDSHRESAALDMLTEVSPSGAEQS
jgi:hypothetical protein